jgi:hypothetical protein
MTLQVMSEFLQDALNTVRHAMQDMDPQSTALPGMLALSQNLERMLKPGKDPAQLELPFQQEEEPW